MSDLYLELRSRIPVVAARTHIGSARLQEAQDAVGLSNEAIARKIPVSEKTWRRWKQKGEIPTYALPNAAAALRLELRELAPEVPAASIQEIKRLEAEAAEDRVLLHAIAGAVGLDPEEVLRAARLRVGEQRPAGEGHAPPAEAEQAG